MIVFIHCSISLVEQWVFSQHKRFWVQLESLETEQLLELLLLTGFSRWTRFWHISQDSIHFSKWIKLKVFLCTSLVRYYAWPILKFTCTIWFVKGKNIIHQWVSVCWSSFSFEISTVNSQKNYSSTLRHKYKFFNSIAGGGGIWILYVSVGNTKRCQLSYKALVNIKIYLCWRLLVIYS